MKIEFFFDLDYLLFTHYIACICEYIIYGNYTIIK